MQIPCFYAILSALTDSEAIMKQTTKRLIAIFSLLLIPLLFFTSCGETLPESQPLRELTIDMVDAMKASDYDEAFSLVWAICTEEEFKDFYDTIEPIFADVEEYDLHLHSTSEMKQEGRVHETTQYLLFSDEKQLLISASMERGGESLSGFFASEADINLKTYIVTSGTLSTLDKTTGWQWVALGVSLLEIAFIFWMTIDCIFRKIDGKYLWLLVILLGIVSLSFSFGDGSFDWAFNVSFMMGYTALIGHIDALVSLRVMLPLGALVYFFLRKRMKPPVAKSQEPVQKTYKSYIPDDEK